MSMSPIPTEALRKGDKVEFHEPIANVLGAGVLAHTEYLVEQVDGRALYVTPLDSISYVTIELPQGTDDWGTILRHTSHAPVAYDEFVQVWHGLAASNRAAQDLQNVLESTRISLEHANARASGYEADFDLVGQMLLIEASERGWCSEFDDFVRSVNRATKCLDLPLRKRTYKVNLTATVSWTVEVEAHDEATAEDEAMPGEDRQDVIDAIRHRRAYVEVTATEVEEA